MNLFSCCCCCFWCFGAGIGCSLDFSAGLVGSCAFFNLVSCFVVFFSIVLHKTIVSVALSWFFLCFNSLSIRQESSEKLLYFQFICKIGAAAADAAANDDDNDDDHDKIRMRLFQKLHQFLLFVSWKYRI